MVDPHRKINILTEDQQNFIEECEEEFRGRFTDEDQEFVAHCKKPQLPPPIQDPWFPKRGRDHRGGYRGGRGGGGRGRYYNNYNNRGRNDYGHHRGERDGNGGGHSSGYNSQPHSYSDSRKRKYFTQ